MHSWLNPAFVVSSFLLSCNYMTEVVGAIIADFLCKYHFQYTLVKLYYVVNVSMRSLIFNKSRWKNEQTVILYTPRLHNSYSPSLLSSSCCIHNWALSLNQIFFCKTQIMLPCCTCPKPVPRIFPLTCLSLTLQEHPVQVTTRIISQLEKIVRF